MIKRNFKVECLFLISCLFANYLESQSLRWSFDVIGTGGQNSTVRVFLKNIGSSSENINTFSTYFYYNNPESAGISFDVSPTTNNLWPNNGTSSSNITNVGTNSNVTITHNRYANISLSDNRIGSPGTDIPANSAAIHVLNINFSNQNPPSFGWLAESDEVPGLVYSNSNFDEFSIIVMGPQFAPLPVKLTTFSAEQYGASASMLNWSTSSEINSDFFGIERSEDGITWTTIGNVRAAGNSSSKLEYSYIDNKLPLNRNKNQIFYYRLRMTDLDGKFEYSDVRGVNFNRTSDWAVSIYPNPTADLINVDLTGLDLGAGDINLSVYDNVARQVISKKIIGNGIELIDVTQLPAGSYNVTVNQGNINHRQTIIKID